MFCMQHCSTAESVLCLCVSRIFPFALSLCPSPLSLSLQSLSVCLSVCLSFYLLFSLSLTITIKQLIQQNCSQVNANDWVFPHAPHTRMRHTHAHTTPLMHWFFHQNDVIRIISHATRLNRAVRTSSVERRRINVAINSRLSAESVQTSTTSSHLVRHQTGLVYSGRVTRCVPQVRRGSHWIHRALCPCTS